MAVPTLLVLTARASPAIPDEHARSERAAFRETVRAYFRDTHPVCPVEPVPATKPAEQDRDRQYAVLAGRIEATLLAGDFYQALDDAALEQKRTAAIVDCKMPDGQIDVEENSWARKALRASFASLARIEPALRAALAKLA